MSTFERSNCFSKKEAENLVKKTHAALAEMRKTRLQPWEKKQPESPNFVLNKWLGSRLRGKESLNVVIYMEPWKIVKGEKEWLTDETIRKTAYRIRNKINQAVYGNATRRFGKELIITIHYHRSPTNHFHCLVEIPEHMDTPFLHLKMKSKIQNICLKDRWLKMPKYKKETINPIGSMIYNGHDGLDTAIVF